MCGKIQDWTKKWQTSDSNVRIIQTWQNTVLKVWSDVAWYVRNADLHRKLRQKGESENARRAQTPKGD